MQCELALNQYVTVYQVIFKVLNFCILPKFEHLQKIFLWITHVEGNTFAELIFVTSTRNVKFVKFGQEGSVQFVCFNNIAELK